MGSKVELELLAVTEKAIGDLRKAQGAIEGIGKTAQSANKSGLEKFKAGFSDFANVAVKGTAMVAAEIKLLEKIFDFGAQGAAVTQTAESFDMLIEKVGATPDLFKQLDKAADGTINDMTLMTSTAKLLAGTTGELSTVMAEAAPRLVEISRAAVKLDPTIGSVQYTFESLAKGIKKNQPLLIDNANIAVKVGKANEVMAAKLGKSVEALTLEEQSVALLNDTLRAGDEIIAQVGGTIESETDRFARLDVAATELGNTFKEILAPGLAEAADGATRLLNGVMELQNAHPKLEEELRRSAVGYEEYNAIHEQLKITQGFIYDGTLKLTNAQLEQWRATEMLVQRYEGYGEAAGVAIGANSGLAAAADGAAAAQANLAMKLKDASAVQVATAMMGELKKAYEDGKIGLEEYLVATTDIGIEYGIMDTESAALARGIELATQRLGEGKIAGKDMGETTARAMVDAKASAWNFSKLVGTEMPESVAKATSSMEGSVPKWRAEFLLAKNEVGGIDSYLRGMDGETFETTLVVHTVGGDRIGGGGGGGGGGGLYDPLDDKEGIGAQHGANFIVPPGYPNDSYKMGVQTGEHVQVMPAGKMGADTGAILAELRRLPDADDIARAVRDAVLMAVG